MECKKAKTVACPRPFVNHTRDNQEPNPQSPRLSALCRCWWVLCLGFNWLLWLFALARYALLFGLFWLAQLSSCSLVCVFPDTFCTAILLSEPTKKHELVSTCRKTLFYRSTRTKTKPSSFMALILWCKAVKRRGTTKSHAQLLSQPLTSILVGLMSFTFYSFVWKFPKISRHRIQMLVVWKI